MRRLLLIAAAIMLSATAPLPAKKVPIKDMLAHAEQYDDGKMVEVEGALLLMKSGERLLYQSKEKALAIYDKKRGALLIEFSAEYKDRPEGQFKCVAVSGYVDSKRHGGENQYQYVAALTLVSHMVETNCPTEK